MNIAEILRNAPKGTKLYSTLCGEVTLDFVDSVNFIHTKTSRGNDCTFFDDGKFNSDEDCDCLLFPSKNKRDWLGWQHELFKEGDIVTYDKGYLRIVKVTGNFTGIDAYGIERTGLLFSNWRYATDEEKDMFYKIYDTYYKDDSGGTISDSVKEIKVKEAIKKDSRIELPVTKVGNDYDLDKSISRIYSLLDEILDKLGELQSRFEEALDVKKEIHKDFKEVVEIIHKLEDA